MNDYLALLKEKAEKDYKLFSEKLLPDTKHKILGVRVPLIKKLAATAIKNGDYVFPENDCEFYEELIFYGLIAVGSKTEFDKKTEVLDKLLCFADSWGITDTVAAAFISVKKEKEKAEKFIYRLLDSDLTYKRRFAVCLLTFHFCGDNYNKEHIEKVLSSKNGEYYVDMAVAWYISVLIIKNRSEGIKIIESFTLPTFIHNKAIQKAVESFRISEDDKKYLKSLKIKK